jgi:lathosterol oxidase
MFWETFLWAQALAIGVSVAGYLLVGPVIDHVWYRLRADEAEDWKLQPHRWPTDEQRRRARRLGVLNMVTCGFAGGCVVTWRELGGWTALSSDPLAHGPAWLFLAVLVDLAILDFGLYWMHRGLHHPWIYRRFHLVHHRFRAPFADTYVAMHPVEQLFYLVVIGLPVFTVPQYAGSFLVALGYTWAIGILDHSGVRAELPLPLHTSNQFHDDHHIYVNANYGHHTAVWDHLYGTARMRPRPAAVVAEAS